ncbi:hypothetical protein F5I97DRAFT_1817860, partial [Phlebopus sp. FC_14]
PATAFTFKALDDFICNNVECGTSAMNYYNKLHHITSNVFPDAVPVSASCWNLFHMQMWLLKMLKWRGFGHQSKGLMVEDLILFCPGCPQPDINLDPSKDKYSCTVIMDGNFKVEHMYDQTPGDQIFLMDDRLFIIARDRYCEYLKNTNHPMERSNCNNHRAVNQVNVNCHKLKATGIGGCACARYGCFIPHALVNFQKKES